VVAGFRMGARWAKSLGEDSGGMSDIGVVRLGRAPSLTMTGFNF